MGLQKGQYRFRSSSKIVRTGSGGWPWRECASCGRSFGKAEGRDVRSTTMSSGSGASAPLPSTNKGGCRKNKVQTNHKQERDGRCRDSACGSLCTTRFDQRDFDATWRCTAAVPFNRDDSHSDLSQCSSSTFSLAFSLLSLWLRKMQELRKSLSLRRPTLPLSAP